MVILSTSLSVISSFVHFNNCLFWKCLFMPSLHTSKSALISKWTLHWHYWSHIQYPGSVISNGRERKSCLGRVFNSKLGRIAIRCCMRMAWHAATSRVENSAQGLSCQIKFVVHAALHSHNHLFKIQNASYLKQWRKTKCAHISTGANKNSITLCWAAQIWLRRPTNWTLDLVGKMSGWQNVELTKWPVATLQSVQKREVLVRLQT